jgi:hypothetical protein
LCSAIAESIRTGTVTSPKEMEPDQRARGTNRVFPSGDAAKTAAELVPIGSHLVLRPEGASVRVPLGLRALA